MRTLIAMSFFMHFLVLGIMIGRRVHFFPRPKIIVGLLAYFFVYHLLAIYILKNFQTVLDPRTEAYKRRLQEIETMYW